MKNLSTLILSLCFIAISYAQQAPIMVCNSAGTTCAPYYTLNDAYTAANTDDYIYLPGGTFQLDSTIKKKINIIGAGFHTDSSMATGRTIINGDIILGAGCDNSLFEGFYLNGSFLHNKVTGDSSINGIKISFCNFNEFNTTYNNGAFKKTNNSIIKNSIARGKMELGGNLKGVNNLLQNSFFSFGIRNIKNSLVKNSIIKGYITATNCGSMCCWASWGIILGSSNTSIVGCILGIDQNSADFCSGFYVSDGSDYLTYENCLTKHSSLISANSSQNNCIFNQTLASTFVNSTSFDYEQSKNFKILNSSPAHSPTCSGCSQIGVYGGSTPWVDIPSNPHIYYKSIQNATNPNGELPAQIKVRIGN